MVRVLVFDSGLGGLSILRALRTRLGPVAGVDYVADTAWFPYGPKPEAMIAQRVCRVIGQMLDTLSSPPSVVVIACNTASTAALGALRQTFPRIPFVGVVPAIKPAALLSRSGVIGLLATPGTVHRPYSDRLIADFASGHTVVRHGAVNLARLAEQALCSGVVDEAAVRAEILPLFENRALDTVVLGCTHYPLLLQTLIKVAPWPVRWVDSAAAVARQTARVLGADPLPRAGGDVAERVEPVPNGTLWLTALRDDLGPVCRAEGLDTVRLLESAETWSIREPEGSQPVLAPCARMVSAPSAD